MSAKSRSPYLVTRTPVFLSWLAAVGFLVVGLPVAGVAMFLLGTALWVASFIPKPRRTR
jgi:hypothetical protein